MTRTSKSKPKKKKTVHTNNGDVCYCVLYLSEFSVNETQARTHIHILNAGH